MVAKITFPKSVKSALQYNEHKVQNGNARWIGAGNILWNATPMNIYQKLAVLENRNMLNDHANNKTIHISLNFSPGEKISEQRLMGIASSYMDKIGFGEQPYFVYQHLDAGHPHLHLVSTTILQDGSRINTHNIGRNQSEKARKAVEQQFGLVRAEQQKHSSVVKPIDITKVTYGKAETKLSISHVLNRVINSYNYTSLPEFNAVLRQYHVMADRGDAEGRMYKHGGLVYRALDEAGNKVGVPIKASSINSKPTLAWLEKKFEVNKVKRELPKELMKKALEEVLKSAPASMKELIGLLAKKNIDTVLRQNEEGRLYGITFVDNENKSVFNGSEVGKAYSIAALQSCFSKKLQTGVSPTEQQAVENNNASSAPFKGQMQQVWKENKSIQNDSLLQQLLTPEPTFENAPLPMLKKYKKRKKKRNV